MILAVLLVARPDQPIVSLAIGVLAGGVGQLVQVEPAAFTLVAPSRDLRYPAIARVTRLRCRRSSGWHGGAADGVVNTLLASPLPLGSIRICTTPTA